jgi:nucleoside phosphorylase
MGLLTNQSYTVGWICALPLEMATARAILDEDYGKPNQQDPADRNNYHLGRIGEHNVVIACLPNGVYGTSSAAVVAAQMLFSFKSIRIGLMVGIGGGAPGEKNDIRLGDVVVSKPGKTCEGVVQYDFGKTVGEGQFTRTGSLNKPPQVLLTAMSSLEADHMLSENKISKFLSEMLMKHPNMQPEFSYQGAERDQLFDADYQHVSDDSTCDSCDARKLKNRPSRSQNGPAIHYGLIASGNQVMRHGITRDRFRDQLDVLCFEMEAAGLMDNFPCVVIRGICDYADSHKNKRWQKYAAAAAAAYAKELLCIIPANAVTDRHAATEVAGK